MGKTFIVELESLEEENFERDGKNIAKVRVQLPSGEMISGSGYRVEIGLSEEARLGLGIELIHSVLGKKLRFAHLYPSEKGSAVQDLGVFLHPQSCQLLIADYDFGSIEEEIDKAEKSSGSTP